MSAGYGRVISAAQGQNWSPRPDREDFPERRLTLRFSTQRAGLARSGNSPAEA
jgi:hypothetical protein